MPFINKSEATKRSKDRKQTAKVQMARTVTGVVFSLSILFTVRLKHLASWKLCFSPKQSAEISGFFQSPLAAHQKHLLLWEAIPQLPFALLSKQILNRSQGPSSQHRPISLENLAFQWNWYGGYIFLMRCDWHLMTDCVSIRPMGISRTNLICAWRTAVFFSVSHHSPSPFFHSLQTFRSNMVHRSCLQKIRLFCSLGEVRLCKLQGRCWALFSSSPSQHTCLAT